jgi:hypothetical protein
VRPLRKNKFYPFEEIETARGRIEALFRRLLRERKERKCAEMMEIAKRAFKKLRGYTSEHSFKSSMLYGRSSPFRGCYYLDDAVMALEPVDGYEDFLELVVYSPSLRQKVKEIEEQERSEEEELQRLRIEEEWRRWVLACGPCMLCGRPRDRQVCARHDVWGWDFVVDPNPRRRSQPSELDEDYRESKYVLCVGCWNTARSFARRKMELEEVRKLIGRLSRMPVGIGADAKREIVQLLGAKYESRNGSVAT